MVALGFDDPQFKAELKAQDALLLDVLPKLNGKVELDADEIDAVKAEVEDLPAYGADPWLTKCAKGLRRKLGMR